MTVSESANRLNKNKDLVRLAILLAVTFGIGVFLIATTVLISKDGVFYIEQARKFSSEPVEVIKEHSFGYPFLIFTFHILISIISDSIPVYSWIYSAQSVNLLCRLLALVPLFYIGKLFVGGRMSFFGLLVLIVLPYPAQFGSDALRDWPHILFLATGFLLLLRASQKNKIWMYGAAGLVTGFGFMIRQECIQMILYGSLWLMIGLIIPKKNITKSALLVSLIVLLVCFAVVVTPYVIIRGRTFTIPHDKNVILIEASETHIRQVQFNGNYDKMYSASSIPYDILIVVGQMVADISENLMFYFIPFWLVGIYLRFRRRREAIEAERFYVPAFLILNLIILVVVGSCWGYTSRRYSLPLLALTFFYVPLGLKFISDLLERKFPRGSAGTGWFRLSWFNILLLIGIIICIPKLFKPINYEKSHYRKAAQWLEVNTAENELIAVPDVRISFYAQRESLKYEKEMPERVNYVVKVIKGEKGVPVKDEVPDEKKVFSVGGGISDIEIYDLRGYISENVSLTGYQWERLGDERYIFSFTFKVEDKFEKDWAIYFHAWPAKENLTLYKSQRESGFENWDFYPEVVTSLWPENKYITITREIHAKPIYYNIELGFYGASEGRYGRAVNLGWIDLGTAVGDNNW